MALRLIHSTDVRSNGKQCKVYRDAEWNEYRVRLYINGVHRKSADYFTDDKQDALETADATLARN